jgi:hypothetical protein
MESMPKQSWHESRGYSRFSAWSDRVSKDQRSVSKSEEGKKSESNKWEDKLDSLKAYRRSKSLCSVLRVEKNTMQHTNAPITCLSM